jgi:hypothetical protein
MGMGDDLRSFFRFSSPLSGIHGDRRVILNILSIELLCAATLSIFSVLHFLLYVLIYAKRTGKT